VNYREVELLGLKTLGDSGTEIIDVDVTDPITAIMVYFKVKNESSHVDNVPAQDALDKIELIDGGQVYLSLSGSEAIAVAAYESGRYPRHWFDESANLSSWVRIPLFFGRFMGDQEFGFDPTKLKNPQIKLTWSNSASHATGETQAEVFAKVMEGLPGPSQCLLTKAIKSFTTAASGDEPTDLPIDYPYRKLYVRVYKATTYGGNILTQFKLDCDVGKLIPFDISDEDFTALCEEAFPMFHVNQFVRADQGTFREGRLGYLVSASMTARDDDSIVSCNPTAPQYYRTYCRMSGTGATKDDVYCVVNLFGTLPEYAWCYQFGRPNEPETWFRSGQFKGIKLILTQGSVSAAASILLQQPRSLP